MIDATDDWNPSHETRFPTGNQLWRRRKAFTGPPRKFETAQDLWDACFEYFEWCEGNPLKEAKAFQYEGKPVHTEVSKMRVMSIEALSIFIGVTSRAWRDWRSERADLAETIEAVEEIIASQQLEGAAAGLLNPAIVARKLGLVDKRELTGKDGGPIGVQTFTDLTDDELAERRAALVARRKAEEG
ncbi:MAG: DNA-packaging protein [Proteobacteria bacterium]|nr:DNA-packaging protein [Pseudomonadota bacterium]